jgi:molecular chaperone HscB
MVQCPSCERLQEPRLICADCAAPLVCSIDCFAALGLTRKLQIDSDTLEGCYHDLGRRLHPDRFANAPAKLRDLSLRATALLTRAYRTLRDPVSRGRYWLELNGRKLAENNQQVPPELAAIVFEAQEELSELRAASAPDGVEALPVKNRRAQVRELLDGLGAELEENFGAFDRIDAKPSDELFDQLKRILAATGYLRTLARDIEKAIDRRAAA